MLKKIVLILSLFIISIWSIYITNASDKVQEADFMIETKLLFWDSKIDTWTATTEELINKTLWTIIQNLMIAMGSISLFIMTIWAWYMIFYNWQDDILSKWKSIFTWWVIALVVALTSYYMVAILRFVLYKWN